jgi:hypothetical protein
MFARVAYAQDAMSFAVYFSTWTLVPYVVLLAIIARSRDRKIKSIITTVGSTLLAIFGVWSFHEDLSFFYEPLPPGAGRCAPPLVEALIPVVQLTGCFFIAGVAWLSDKLLPHS